MILLLTLVHGNSQVRLELFVVADITVTTNLMALMQSLLLSLQFWRWRFKTEVPAESCSL